MPVDIGRAGSFDLARLDSAMRRDVTLRYGCAVTAKKIRSSWSRVPLGGRISRQSGLVQDGGMVIGGASRCARQWFVLTRARACVCVCGCVWVCVCVCVRARKRLCTQWHARHTRGKVMRCDRQVDVAIPGWRVLPSGEEASRRYVTMQWRRPVQVAACTRLAHGGARAPFHLHNAAAADATRAQHTLFARLGLVAMPRC